VIETLNWIKANSETAIWIGVFIIFGLAAISKR
jgi:hypothetical protein